MQMWATSDSGLSEQRAANGGGVVEHRVPAGMQEKDEMRCQGEAENTLGEQELLERIEKCRSTV